MTLPTDPEAAIAALRADLTALRADVDALKAAAVEQDEEKQRLHAWIRSLRRDSDTDPKPRTERT